MYTLANRHGLIAKVMAYGATLVELHVPDKAGQLADVVHGFDNLDDYHSNKNQYFGCTTGRVANRIANGRFTLAGKIYELAINDDPNHLHGGPRRGLDKVLWHVKPQQTVRGPAVEFTYLSPDGEEGYPGNLSIAVTYTLTNEDELWIEYMATTDKPTPVNLTNHTYWNLAGGGTVLQHALMIAAEYYTPTDETLIPTGEIRPVAGTPLDFTKPMPVGQRVGAMTQTPALGYDHNYVLLEQSDELSLATRLSDPRSGRVMELHTTEPGLQLYSGNFLEGQVGKRGQVYEQHSAICLETQHFPDSVNQPKFPSITLYPAQIYRQKTVHKFFAE